MDEVENFRAAKDKASSRSMGVMYVGTAETEGYFAAAEQTHWTHVLRQMLQDAKGSISPDVLRLLGD